MTGIRTAFGFAFLLSAAVVGHAQERDPRIEDIVSGWLVSSTVDSAAKRDALVAAAYAARRVVEDSPEGRFASVLNGSGITVFGEEKLTYERLQNAMLDACMDAPDAVCLADSAYVLGARALAEHKEKLKQENEAWLLDPTLIENGLQQALFRAAVARRYAELDLGERVLSTYTHHVAADAPVSVVTLALSSPDFSYALHRSGQDEVGAKVVQIALERASEKGLREEANRFIALAEVAKAIGSVAAGRVLETSQVRDSAAALALEIEKVRRPAKGVSLLAAEDTILDGCLDLAEAQQYDCVLSISRSRGRRGDVNATQAALSRLSPAQIQGWEIFDALYVSGDLEAARPLYEASDPERTDSYSLAQLFDLGDGKALDLAIAAATSENVAPEDRDWQIEAVAWRLAIAERTEELEALMATVSDAKIKENFAMMTDLTRVDVYSLRGELGQAAAAVLALPQRLRVEKFLELADRAIQLSSDQ